MVEFERRYDQAIGADTEHIHTTIWSMRFQFSRYYYKYRKSTAYTSNLKFRIYIWVLNYFKIKFSHTKINMIVTKSTLSKN